jgi:transketolase
MGEQALSAVTGRMCWVPYPELERIRASQVDRVARAALFADACRLNALYMIARAGSGHIGSSFSSLDLVSWLHLEELPRAEDPPGNLYFSSKGHDAPGLYAVLLGLGQLPFESLHALRRLGGLPGHPDVGTPGMPFNTGSLGMGISKAKGLTLARRQRGLGGRTYVLTGDGELQEGQIWEALLSAPRARLDEITVIVDHNKLQSDAFVERTSPLGDLTGKFESFGAWVTRVDGHDLGAFAATLERARSQRGRLKVIVADTVKGRGVSCMEHTSFDSDVTHYRFHSGAPDAESYARAVEELSERLARRADALRLPRLCLEWVERPSLPSGPPPSDALIPAYAAALVDVMEKVPAVVALDADLAHDTGQSPARERFPERCHECGIAEMDMVSMAGGMARAGLVPICHSFACFLSTRPNEQIYNNATERTKVVYVASLAGLLPAGPGHSHQSVRDIAALRAIPDLVLIAPSSAAEVRAALAWCVARPSGSSVLRLESVPCSVPFALPAGYELREGVGVSLRPGRDALVVGYGPLLLSAAVRAAEKLAEEGLSISVVNLPWLNRVDRAWLARIAESTPHLFTLDNHFVEGGQGEMLAAQLSELGFERPPRLKRFGVEGIPACGANDEVLRHHALDAESLAARMLAALRG